MHYLELHMYCVSLTFYSLSEVQFVLGAVQVLLGVPLPSPQVEIKEALPPELLGTSRSRKGPPSPGEPLFLPLSSSLPGL